MKATATANANIALIKYWGKRDKKLMLPQNGSISMTCEGMKTDTTVEFSSSYQQDEFVLDGKSLTEGREFNDVVAHLSLIREQAGITEKAKIVSNNSMPTAAGLASSASGFAALSVAGAHAAGLQLSSQEITMLSRRGSGSASRSTEEGFVEWFRGEKEDGSDSFGKTILKVSEWPEFRMLATIVSSAAKKVKSRAGMAQSVDNCPYYKGWLDTVNEDLEIVRKALHEKDFTLVGKTAEYNALKMHAVMMTTTPAIVYWMPATLEIMHAIMAWRAEGLESYYTMDAGPQVKVLCLEKDVAELTKRLQALSGVEKIIECKPGQGAQLLEEHLF
jgi:diphosphomevalonate decarboxylase